MDEGDWLAARFEENRPHLRAVAYRCRLGLILRQASDQGNRGQAEADRDTALARTTSE